MTTSETISGGLLTALGLAAACLIIFWNLGAGSIDLRDEALTAGRSLYIYHTGKVLDLQVNGELSIRKPPLVYMLTALSYRVFGINELGLRVPNALFGLGIFAVTAFGAWRMAGPLWAGLSPWILLGCFNIIRVSREALTDTAFVFGIALSFMTLAVHMEQQSGDTESRSPWTMPVLFATGFAIALLSKGPLAFYIPLCCLPFLLIEQRSLFKPYLIASCTGSLPFVIWFTAQAMSSSKFLLIYLGEEYLQRIDYDSTFLTQFIRSPWYYLSNLWRWFRISGALSLLFSCWIVICHFLQRRMDSCRWARRPGLLLLTAGWIGFFILLSFVSHKSRRYILPVFPLMTLITVAGLSGLLTLCRSSLQKYASILLIVTTITLGLWALYRHYMPVPDYLPLRKNAALKIKPLTKKGLAVYSDDPRLAPILHFYLDRVVPVIKEGALPTNKRWLFITDGPTSAKSGQTVKRLNRQYWIVLHR